MDELRNDLMGCPPSTVAALVAELSEDPTVKLGTKILSATGCVQTIGSDTAWRDFLYNIIPIDGRHPHAPTLKRLLEAAQQHGWADPKAISIGSSM